MELHASFGFEPTTNYWAVLVAALAYWILGAIWYTGLFGKQWMALTGMTEEKASAYALEQLEYLLASLTAPKDTAAILIESVLGEGGYVVPPTSFMKGLREICDKHGILIIFDEVQSGFGRTGKWFALEHFDVIPDIITAAKGLASGMPLSGVFSRTDIMKKLDVGSIGGTYGGNAVACAAGVATIRAMRDEKMLENAA